VALIVGESLLSWRQKLIGMNQSAEIAQTRMIAVLAFAFVLYEMYLRGSTIDQNRSS
jgi:hypothetical protein